MKRQIKSTLRTTIVYRMAELSDLRAWLIERAFADKLLLLAHSEDGVIWGRLEAGRITTAHDVFPKHRLADLEPGSLHTCRLFGESGELLVWRTRQGWAARLWLDGQGEEHCEYFNEDQVLWGTQIEAPAEHYTLVSDGVSGLVHAPPLAVAGSTFDAPAAAKKLRPLRLTLRHYLAENSADGVVYISGSRLVGLAVNEKEAKR